MENAKYTKCSLCDSQIPVGHPCMRCVENKKMSIKQKQILPENLIDFVSILRLQNNDTLVFKDIPDGFDEEIFVKLFSEIESIKKMKINIMFLPENTEVLIIRSKDELP